MTGIRSAAIALALCGLLVAGARAQDPAAAARAPNSQWPEPGSGASGRARALEGDVIELDGQPVRLFGIDAPAMRGDPRGPVARAALGDLLAAAGGTAACDVLAPGRGGVPVARCRAGGRDLSDAMVRDGRAFAARAFTADYDAAEAEARAEGRGFWGGDGGGPRWVEILKELTPLVAIVAAIIAVVGQVVLRRLDNAQRRRSLAAAFRGEIMTWVQMVDVKETEAFIKDAIREIDETGKLTLPSADDAEETPEHIWRRFPTFMANIGEVGLLGPALAGRVTMFYTNMVRSRVQGVAIHKMAAAGNMDQLKDSLNRYLELQVFLSDLGGGLVADLQRAARKWRLQSEADLTPGVGHEPGPAV